jgi:hypothetical protein
MPGSKARRLFMVSTGIFQIDIDGLTKMGWGIEEKYLLIICRLLLVLLCKISVNKLSLRLVESLSMS